MTLRTALLFQADNFIGREYLHQLNLAGMTPDLVATVGQMAKRSIVIEKKRTKQRWNPPPPDAGQNIKHYASLTQDELWSDITDASIDVVIQGGIGILKPEMLAAPQIGFVNVHPGRLPEYRGNTCPEWALYNGEEIYATAHIIDTGIDTGPVICEALYDVSANWDYFDLRANLYRHCAHVLIEALSILNMAGNNLESVLTPQDRNDGHYWEPIPKEKLAKVIWKLEQTNQS